MSATSGPRIAFRCDATNGMGGGHVMRCLTLANALSEAGAKVAFVAAAMPEALHKRIVDAGHQCQIIPGSPELQRNGGKWEEPPLGVEAQRADARAMGAAAGQSDWLIVDHYLLDANWHSEARSFAKKLLVIDDLANRPYDCDLLLDQTFGRSADDYRNLVPRGATILAGAAYALLRPEFASERPAALERRQAGGPVNRILISMGTTDPGSITARIVERVAAVLPRYAVDVILGPQAASLEHVRALAVRGRRVSIHVNPDRMAQLLSDADIAIGAAGTSSWERCCLGLPTITFVLADNQRLVAANLDRAGAAVLADSTETIPAIVQRLADDERARLSMIAAAAAVADGLGAKRIADSIVGANPASDGDPILRPARQADSRAVWLWRNDFMTRSFSQSATPIPWPDHAAWWGKAFGFSDRQIMIAEVGGVPAAALRFDRIGEREFEVSINLAPSARGSGLGARILLKACSAFQAGKEPVQLLATIHRNNPASRRIFEKTGFVPAGSLSNSDFERYVLAEGTFQ